MDDIPSLVDVPEKKVVSISQYKEMMLRYQRLCELMPEEGAGRPLYNKLTVLLQRVERHVTDGCYLSSVDARLCESLLINLEKDYRR